MTSMNLATLARRMFVSLALALAAGGVLAAPATYRLHVDGLACPFCAYGLEKKLGAVDGVLHLETNIADGTVTVTMQDGVALGEAAAAQAVKQAGFTLRKFEPVQATGQSVPQGQTK